MYLPDPALSRVLYLVLLALACVGAVLAAAYVLRLLRRVLQGPQDPVGATPVLALSHGPGAQGPVEPAALPDVTRGEWLAWSPLVVVILALGLWPQLLLGITAPATGTLLAALGVGS